MKRRYNKVRKYEEGGDTSIDSTNMITRGMSTLGNLYNTVFNLDDELDKKDDSIENEIQSLSTTKFSGGNDTLAKMSTMLPTWSDITADDLGGETDLTKTGISSFISGYTSGLSSGIGPLWSLIPAVADTGVNLLSGVLRNDKINSRVGLLNNMGRQAENQVKENFKYAISNTDAKNDRFRIQNMLNTNYAAFGGLLETNGSNWDTGATFIDNGGTHQNNPLGGVQYGVAADGVPNLVEEGEVVIKVRNSPIQGHSFAEGGSPTYEDFVVSNREFPILEEIAEANITDNPNKYVGWSWAKIYKDVFKRSGVEETPNRQDSKDYVDSLNNNVALAHEKTRLRNQQEQIMDSLKKATPEQQDLILQQAGYPNLLEEAAYAAHGGKIYIKPSKRGTFTAAASKHGMGVQEFASKVLANNASRWHDNGGYLFAAGGNPDDPPKGSLAWMYGEEPSSYGVDQWGNYIIQDGTRNTETPLKGVTTPSEMFKNQDDLTAYYRQRYTDYLKSKNKNITDNQIKKKALNNAEANEFLGYLRNTNDARDIALSNLWASTLDLSNNGIRETNSYLERAKRERADNTKSYDGKIGIEHAPFYYNKTEIERMPSLLSFTPPPPERPQFKSAIDNTISDDITDDTTNDAASTGIPNNDWILPAISGANLLTDIMGITNTADYSNANRIGRAILPPRYIGYDSNGRYVKPLITDKNYISARLGNQNITAINAAKDLAGGNSATALNNIALNNYINSMAIGQAMAQTDEANNEAIRQAIAANNAVDRANAEGVLNADRANQSAWENYANRYATQKTKEAMLREEIDNQVASNKSANWNNFLENMQGYFDNQRNREMANLQYAWSGYQYKGKDGKIHLQYNTPEEEEKAKRFVKKQPKDKQKNYVVEPV